MRVYVCAHMCVLFSNVSKSLLLTLQSPPATSVPYTVPYMVYQFITVEKPTAPEL